MIVYSDCTLPARQPILALGAGQSSQHIGLLTATASLFRHPAPRSIFIVIIIIVVIILVSMTVLQLTVAALAIQKCDRNASYCLLVSARPSLSGPAPDRDNFLDIKVYSGSRCLEPPSGLPKGCRDRVVAWNQQTELLDWLVVTCCHCSCLLLSLQRFVTCDLKRQEA